MNNTPDPKESKEESKKNSANGDPKQQQSDPQLSELDGLKKGGVEPQVHPEDKPEKEDS